MRYYEIIAETDTAAKAQKAAQKRFSARRKMADAERQKSRAGQDCQDALRAADERKREAQSTLQSL